jgi:hypothetical protein
VGLSYTDPFWHLAQVTGSDSHATLHFRGCASPVPERRNRSDPGNFDTFVPKGLH